MSSMTMPWDYKGSPYNNPQICLDDVNSYVLEQESDRYWEASSCRCLMRCYFHSRGFDRVLAVYTNGLSYGSMFDVDGNHYNHAPWAYKLIRQLDRFAAMTGSARPYVDIHDALMAIDYVRRELGQ